MVSAWLVSGMLTLSLNAVCAQVHKVDSVPRHHAVISEYEEVEDEATWTSEIPEVLLTYGDASEAALDYQEAQEAAAAAAQGSHHQSSNSLPPPALADFSSASFREASASNTPQGPSSIPAILPDPGMFALSRRPLAQLQQVQPPILPAQLEKGVLNATVLVAKGSGDDNSILPKPDHSVLNHLAASPIKGGLLSVGVTTRYRRKVSAELLRVSQADRTINQRTCIWSRAVRHHHLLPQSRGMTACMDTSRPKMHERAASRVSV